MKSALVVGASRGIGRQIAKTFAENGYGVCVAAKTVESSVKTPGLCLTIAMCYFLKPQGVFPQ